MLGQLGTGFVTSITAEEWLEQKLKGSVGKGIFEYGFEACRPAGNDLPKGEVGLLYGAALRLLTVIGRKRRAPRNPSWMLNGHGRRYGAHG